MSEQESNQIGAPIQQFNFDEPQPSNELQNISASKVKKAGKFETRAVNPWSVGNMSGEQAFNKREQFSISLRQKKKSNILQMKRMRNNIVAIKRGDQQYFLKDQTSQGLTEALRKIEQSVKLPFGQAHSPFRICDLILILREMSEIASKEENDEMRMTLLLHESTKNILLMLFTKTYNDQSNANTMKNSATEGGMIETEDLVQLMIAVCRTLCTFSSIDAFCSDVVTTYNFPSVCNVVIQRCFMTNLLDIQQVIDSRDVAKHQARVALMTEILWMTNNFMANEGQEALAIMAGLNKTYLELIEGYFKIHEAICPEEPLNSELLQTFTWGFQILSRGLQTQSSVEKQTQGTEPSQTEQEYLIHHAKENKLIDFKLSDLDKRSLEQQLTALRHKQMCQPFISFIKEYMFKAEKLIQDSTGHNQLFKTDCVNIIQQSAINFSDDDIVAELMPHENNNYNTNVVELAFAHFNVKDAPTIKPCLIIIGQFIALSDKDTHGKYISDKYNLLQILKETLEEGSLSHKKDALWVLQSLACDPAIANLIILDERNLIQQVLNCCSEKQYQIKQEAFLCLGTLVGETSLPKEQIFDHFVKQNAISVLHDELDQQKQYDHGVVQVLIIQTLSQFFTKIPGLAMMFLKNFGGKVFEDQQSSQHENVYLAASELMQEHYDCKQMGEYDGDLDLKDDDHTHLL